MINNSTRDELIANARSAIENLSAITFFRPLEERSGALVLNKTLEELIARLNGSFRAGFEKYFYIDFLRGNRVLLLENYLPDLERNFFTNGDNSLLGRIAAHASDKLISLEERLGRDFAYDENFMFAQMIDNYLRLSEGKTSFAPMFVNTQEEQRQEMLRIVDMWHTYALKSNNFGVFRQVKDYWANKINDDAKQREETLKNQIEGERQRVSKDPALDIKRLQPCFDKINQMIEHQNYTAAEDGLLAESAQFETDAEKSRGARRSSAHRQPARQHR